MRWTALAVAGVIGVTASAAVTRGAHAQTGITAPSVPGGFGPTPAPQIQQVPVTPVLVPFPTPAQPLPGTVTPTPGDTLNSTTTPAGQGLDPLAPGPGASSVNAPGTPTYQVAPPPTFLPPSTPTNQIAPAPGLPPVTTTVPPTATVPFPQPGLPPTTTIVPPTTPVPEATPPMTGTTIPETGASRGASGPITP